MVKIEKMDRVSTRRTSNNSSDEEEPEEPKQLRSSKDKMKEEKRGVKRHRTDSDPASESPPPSPAHSNEGSGNSSEEDVSEEEESSTEDSDEEYRDFKGYSKRKLRKASRKAEEKNQRRSPRQKKSMERFNPSWIFADGRRGASTHPYSFRSTRNHSDNNVNKQTSRMMEEEEEDDEYEDNKTSPPSYGKRHKNKQQHNNKKDDDDEEAHDDEMDDDDESPTLPAASNDSEDNCKDFDEPQRVTRHSRQRMASPASAGQDMGNSRSTRYSRRRGNEQEQESESAMETPTENGTVRRSLRVPKPVRGNNLDETQNSEVSGDMYTRLKSSQSSRKTRTSMNFNEKLPFTKVKRESCEPVARRLRERKTRTSDSAPSLANLLERNRRRRRNKRRNSSSDDGNSSSSSSSMDEHVTRGNRPRSSLYEKPEKVGSKKGFIDINPITVDPTITFESVGGLEVVIEKLREIVVLPLVYKDFYTARNITPPRGILFHGPPGTGKTLLARALANEVSDVGGRKVSFFVRKGADLLNKWVGESERHLRQLFEAASRCQPSIIFFDEIDGLAPARSSKTDQVHNSVVSTLLAELDGVKDRGDIIIIGATNRIDSLDPALRRPGRFDHEFPFLLPTNEGRVQIIKSHVSKWSDNISETVMKGVAGRCVGFSGADLKLLCAEASMCALRRRYPQIYSSKQKYLLNYDSVIVGPSDWYNAMKKVSRSSDRSIGSIITAGKPLPKAVVPLLATVVDNIRIHLQKLYTLKDEDALMREPAAKRFLIYTRHGHDDNGVDQYIVPAVLHIFESVPVFSLSLESFSLQDTNADCKTITQVFAEAARVNKFAIVLIPSLNVILKMISEQSQQVLYQQIMSTEKPILVLATAQPSEDDLPDNILHYFNNFSHQVTPAPLKARKQFFLQVFNSKSLRVRVKTIKAEQILDELQLAPKVPPNMLSEEELKFITRKETSMLRSLRKFLREVLAKLARNKKYCDFTTPVDVNEVPDYRDIIESPMDFETMMCKLDQGIYNSAAEFLQDINLIRDNAVSYNPITTFDGKSIIHRAHELVDYAHLIIEDEMDSDFEEACQNITKKRQERAAQAEAVAKFKAQTQALALTEQIAAQNSSPTSSMVDRSIRPVRLHNNMARKNTIEPSSVKQISENSVLVATKKRRKKKLKLRKSHPSSPKKGQSIDEELLPQAPEQLHNGTLDNDEGEDVFEDSISTVPPPVENTITLYSDSDAESSFSTQFSDGHHKFVQCANFAEYEKDLKNLLTEALSASEEMGVLRLLDFRYQLMYAVETNYDMEDKKNLLNQLQQVIKHFATVFSQDQEPME